jgi:predicted membrane channel-forming protein YqfA (hemolysin III family)
MYAISAAAFFFYVARLPERFWPGLVNYIGSSHQLWHILIVAALYHWHNTGILYLHFRATNTCQAEYAYLFPDQIDVLE